MSPNQRLDTLRKQLDDINGELLQLLNRRTEITQEVGLLKQEQGIPEYDPVREHQMLDQLSKQNEGPLDETAVKQLFNQIFNISLTMQKEDHKKHLLVSRKRQEQNTVIQLPQEVTIGGGHDVMVAGPCSVESEQQLRTVERH